MSVLSGSIPETALSGGFAGGIRVYPKPGMGG
jgi:hypothetical protein